MQKRPMKVKKRELARLRKPPMNRKEQRRFSPVN